MNKQTISARINSALYDRFKNESKRQGLSQRVLLERAIEMYLKLQHEGGGGAAIQASDWVAMKDWRQAVTKHLSVLTNSLTELDNSVRALEKESAQRKQLLD